jgi:hypothetical protein
MAREATGTWFQRRSAYYVWLSIGAGNRESFALPTARNEGQAEQQTKLLAELVKTLRKSVVAPLEVSQGSCVTGLVVSTGDLATSGNQTPDLATIRANSGAGSGEPIQQAL